MQGITIIIPLRSTNIKLGSWIAENYQCLIEQCLNDLTIEVLVADSSDEPIFNALHQQFSNTSIIHFQPAKVFQSGKNDKLNNIHAALSMANFDFIILFDDDVCPTKANVMAIYQNLQTYDYLRCMIEFKTPSFFDLCDLAGICFINFISSRKQFWANLAFKKSILNIEKFIDKDLLFDELAIENQCRKQSNRFYYQIDPKVLIEGSTNSKKKFLEQRLRYAYENIKFPIRFIVLLLILPIVFMLGIFLNWAYSITLIFLGSILIGLTTFYSAKKYLKIKNHKRIGFYAVIWFWFYPFFSWIALINWITGGIKFGPNKIRRVA